MRLRKNMKRTAAAALALSMAVSTAAVPASAGYTIDMSGANITGDVEIKQEADGSGTKITISVDGQDKTTDFSDGKEDDKITITGDNEGRYQGPGDHGNGEQGRHRDRLYRKAGRSAGSGGLPPGQPE